MNVGLLLIVIGLFVAILVNWLLGLILLAVGALLLLAPALGRP